MNPRWAEMIVMMGSFSQELVEEYVDLTQGKELRCEQIKPPSYFRKCLVRYPESEFIEELRKRAGAEDVLSKIAAFDQNNRYGEVVRKLLHPFTSISPEDTKYYYIQKPVSINARNIENRQLLRYKYKSGSLSERFTSLMLDLTMFAGGFLDSSVVVQGTENVRNEYIFGWKATNKGEVAAMVGMKVEEFAESLKPEDKMKKFLSNNTNLIARAVVDIYETLTKGRNWDDPAIEVGMAISDIATMLYELAKYEKDTTTPLINNVQLLGLSSKRIGGGNQYSSVNVFVEYAVADGEIQRPAEEEPYVVDSLDENLFFKGKHGEVMSTLFDMKMKNGVKIPRPTASLRPDWTVNGTYGGIMLTGEAKCKVTDAEIPPDFMYSVIATASQLAYSDRGLLLQTYGNCMKLYEMIKSPTEKNRIPMTCHKTVPYDIQPRFDDTNECSDSNDYEMLPKFVMEGSVAFAHRKDVEKKWELMHVFIRTFLHAAFDIVDRIVEFWLGKDMEKAKDQYTLMKQAGLICQAQKMRFQSQGPKDVVPGNMYRYSLQQYLMIKEYMEKKKLNSDAMKTIFGEILQLLDDLYTQKGLKPAAARFLIAKLREYDAKIMKFNNDEMIDEKEKKFLPQVMLPRRSKGQKAESKRRKRKILDRMKEKQKEEKRLNKKAKFEQQVKIEEDEEDVEEEEEYSDQTEDISDDGSD